MALFDKKMRTSQQKAQRAQMGIFARLLGCGYLVYIMVQLIQTSLEDENKDDRKMMLIIAAAFLLATAVVLTITVIELVRNVKAGQYRASAYTDDFEQAHAVVEPAENGDAVGEDADKSEDGGMDDDAGDEEDEDTSQE